MQGCGREVHAHSAHDLSSLYFKKLSSCLGNEEMKMNDFKLLHLFSLAKCITTIPEQNVLCSMCLIVFWALPYMLYTSLKFV